MVWLLLEIGFGKDLSVVLRQEGGIILNGLKDEGRIELGSLQGRALSLEVVHIDFTLLCGNGRLELRQCHIGLSGQCQLVGTGVIGEADGDRHVAGL